MSHAIAPEPHEHWLERANILSYERIIYHIRQNTGEREWHLTKRVLGWMTCAARPLRWHEVQGAVSIGFDGDEEVADFNHDRA